VVGLCRCLMKSDLILKIVIVQINKAARLQSSPNERKNRNVFIYAICYTEHMWMYAHGKLSIIGQLHWEWHPTNRRLCVYIYMCIWWMEETKPDTEVQRKLRATCGETLPSCEGILQWVEQFRATSSIKKWKSSVPPSVSPWAEVYHMVYKIKWKPAY
jgi:hypothetical protein